MAGIAPNRDLYTVLGIAPDSDADTVRRAFREMARTMHPDVNPSPDAARRFAEITHAYKVLSDPPRRSQYDQQRQSRPTIVSRTPASPTVRGVLRGRDVEVVVHLSLRDAVTGVERKIDVPRREVCAVCVGAGAADGGTSVRCPKCQGTGGTRVAGEECVRCQGSGVLGDPPCANCGGAGRKQGLTQITVAIPPAVEEGQRLVLKGEGDAGPRNGPRGDLVLIIVVDPDPVLRRAGIDILMELTIDADVARQGTLLDVPSLKGPRRLRIPAGILDGHILRIGGAGIRPKGMVWHRGDQFVTVRIKAADSIRREAGEPPAAT